MESLQTASTSVIQLVEAASVTVASIALYANEHEPLR